MISVTVLALRALERGSLMATASRMYWESRKNQKGTGASCQYD